MTPSDLFVILNPAADRGRVERLVPRLERALRDAGAGYRLVRTRGRGHAVELAAEAVSAGWPAVVAVGGDGVVHEVVNGLMRGANGSARAALGVVGAGSGNDFIKMLGLPPRAPEAAVRRMLGAEPRAVDVGRVSRWVAEGGGEGEWFFTNGIGLGFDAQVAVEASRVRRVRGLLIYAVALARTLRHLRAPRVRVVVDGVEVADRALILATVANGACHGGSFWLAPDARPDDGRLDVLVGDARGVGAVLRLLPKVLRGEHLGEVGVALHRGTRVEIQSGELLPIHADGEIVATGVRELTIDLLPGAVHVLA